MLKISIPTPCHEDWNKMTPNNQGRHCDSCMKTVVDFTAMSDDEVKYFLLNNKQEHACGRFTTKQLQTIQVELPPDIFVLQMPLWKRFLVACLFVFGTTLFSCEVKHADPVTANTVGEVIKKGKPGSGINEENPFRGMLGMLVYKTTDTIIPPAYTVYNNVVYGGFSTVQPDSTRPEIMGDIEYVQEDTTTVTIPVLPEVVGKMQLSPADTIPKPVQQFKKGEIRFIPQQKDSGDCNNFS